jgi:hypothetical protein
MGESKLIGRYLTNGRRLVRVLGEDGEGGFYAECAATEEVLQIYHHETGLWRIVSRRKQTVVSK